jgi:hypothetical protein
MRLYNPQWNNVTDPTLIMKKDVNGKYPMQIEIFYSAAPSANATEIGSAADSALDGTTTPVQLIVVSSSATDTDTSVGNVRAVHLIGLTVASATDYINGVEKPVYSVEEVRMNGTTNVTTTRYYVRVMHAYAIEWGTGGGGATHDAEGNITIENPENTTKIGIDAGDNDSNNTIIYIGDGFYGRWKALDISVVDNAYNNT